VLKHPLFLKIHLPTFLSDNDIAAILQACPSIIQHGRLCNSIVLEEHFLASKGFLDKSVQLIEGLMKEKAEKGLLKIESPIESIEEEEERSSKKRGSSSKGAPAKKGKGKGNTEEKKTKLRDSQKQTGTEEDKEVNYYSCHQRKLKLMCVL
jgi:hypothetical protein